MAQFYNLDEAARVLGLSPDELKAKAQQREVRAFMDSGSWRFRVADVDELARRRGLGSDPDLSLSDLDLPSMPGSSEEIDLSEFQLGVTSPDLGSPSREGPAVPLTGEEDILLDDLSISATPHSSSSSTIIGMSPSVGRRPSDSDVRLVPEGVAKGPSDSDVQLAGPPPAKPRVPSPPSDSDVTLVSDESGSSIETEAVKPAGSQAASKKPIPSIGSSGEIKTPDFDDSDFELSPSSVVDALEPDPDAGSSDFELSALDGSDEFDAKPGPGPSDSDVTGVEPASSGINLGRPSDSGINLQSVGFLEDADSIELAPLDDDEAPPPPPRPKAAAPPAKAKPRPDLAATPLPKGDKDIFEDTDFEVDVLDSGEDRTVQLEAASDFDLDEGESASEVFAIDEDDVDQNAATALGPASSLAEEDAETAVVEAEDASDDAEGAGWGSDEDEVAPTPSRSGPSPVLAPAGASAEWGGLWVGLLGVATFFMLLLSFVTMDVVRNLYEFRGPTPVSSGLVKTIAGLFGG